MSLSGEVQTRSISGSVPGQLDATQKLRLLSSENSSLIFAYFDPTTASNEDGMPEMRRLSLHEELCRPKRVVVEVHPDGRTTWRFVPKARWEDGVEDEGQWPRLVDVCGDIISMTRDQWDIYKLDPIYDCLVRKAPLYPSIIPKDFKHNGEPSSPITPTFKTPDRPQLKRAYPSSPTTPTAGLFGSSAGPSRNRARVEEVEEDDDIEEEDENEETTEVEEMVVDDSSRKDRVQMSKRLEKVRQNKIEARQRRRELNEQRRKTLTRDINGDPNAMSFTENGFHPAPSPGPSSLHPGTFNREGSVKRKLEDDDDDDESDLGSLDTSLLSTRLSSPASEPKRRRDLSPGSIKRAIEVKRSDRGRKRKQELDKRHRFRSDLRHQQIYNDMLQEAKENVFDRAQSVPTGHTNFHHTESSSTPFNRRSNEPTSPIHETPVDEDAIHQAEIEASKRKLAELERDKPIWEEAARQRRAREEEDRRAAEQRARQSRAQSAEASSSKQSTERGRKQAQDDQAAKAQQFAANLSLKRQRVLNEARQEIEAYRLGRLPWTAETALQRFRAFSERFDAAKFHTGDDVVVFETVPWPMLQCPGTFAVEDVDWASVEAFFSHVRNLTDYQDYCALVEKSHKRFHPDRWRSRRVLVSVHDEEERQCLEVAANTVAQAITPIWKEVTGR